MSKSHILCRGRPVLVAAICTICVLCAVGGDGWAEPRPADPTVAIHVEGARRISAESIRRHLVLTPSGRHDDAALDAAIKRLFATGQFSDVRIVRDFGTLRVEVAERPTIARVAFEGDRAIGEKELVKAAALPSSSPYSRAVGHAALLRVRALYRARAFEDAVIELRTDPLPDNRVAVTFSVREGAMVRIAAVDFSGNRAIPARELRDVVTTRAAGPFDFLRGTLGHDEARLDLDRQLLVRHYQRRGYADVEVARAVAVRAPDTGDWRISYAIDEGRRYRFGGISLVGLPEHRSSNDLRPLITLLPGDIYDPEAIVATIDRIGDALVAAGDLLIEVIAEPRRDPVSGTIDIAFRLRKRPRRMIERIEIVGNLMTRDAVIRRELAIAEGDVDHPHTRAISRDRLRRLGLFKTVEVETVAGGSPDRTRVLVTVKEQQSGEIGFGIGYATHDGITGDIAYTERNLLGRGQYLNLKLAGGVRRHEGEVSFTEPRFLGRRLAAGGDLYYRDVDLLALSSHKSTRAGGRLRLGFDVAANTTAQVNYAFTRTTIYDVGATASAAVRQAVPGLPNASSGAYDTSSIGYSVTYDTRDTVSNPVAGLYISTAQDLAGLGGDARHLRTLAEVRGYYPIADRIGLAARVVGGHVTGYGGSSVRLLDNFNRGGETIRGFATSGIGPRDIASAKHDALGGTRFVATSTELRFPLPFLPSGLGGLRGAVFADAGSLWGLSGPARAVPGVVGTSAGLRASAGVGLVWDSPVGPLRVDYAQPLIKLPFDKTQPLRFGMGPGF